MVGYSFAADAHPTLTPAEYEAILPSNQALFNRSVYADSSSLYDLKSWIPQARPPNTLLVICPGLSRSCVEIIKQLFALLS